MAAEFKSHVLLRDEKGLFGIPFKRLLLAGVGGGLTYTVFSLALPNISLPAGALCGLQILLLTGRRGGLPLWQRLLYRVRGALLLGAVRDSGGMFGRLAQMLDLPLELVRLDGTRVFASAEPDLPIDMREWVTFARASDDEGLVFVAAPMTEALR